MHPKKKTVGVRIPDNEVVQARGRTRGTVDFDHLLLPGDEQPLSSGWEVIERLGDQVDGVVDLKRLRHRTNNRDRPLGSSPVILRRGSGETDRFE